MERLTKSISVEELLHMREEGLTNRQIAERLEISNATVYRYIGRQPDGLKAAYGSICARVRDDHPAQRAEEKPAGRTITLQEQYRKTVYAGAIFDYTVLSTGQIKIEKRGQGQHLPEYRETINLTLDAIPGLMQELMDIAWLAKEEDHGNHHQ